MKMLQKSKWYKYQNQNSAKNQKTTKIKIKQLRKCFPSPAAAAPAPLPSHQSKKTNPFFDPQGVSRFWWVQKQNGPKLSEDHFCFWSKFS